MKPTMIGRGVTVTIGGETTTWDTLTIKTGPRLPPRKTKVIDDGLNRKHRRALEKAKRNGTHTH